MGRKKKELDPLKMEELAAKGMSQKEMAKELGCSHVTLTRRMGDLYLKEGLLLNYRSVQTLHLTALQAAILENITPAKIKDASLLDLVKAFGILHKAEHGLHPPNFQIKGLEKYLQELEGIEEKKIEDTP